MARNTAHPVCGTTCAITPDSRVELGPTWRLCHDLTPELTPYVDVPRDDHQCDVDHHWWHWKLASYAVRAYNRAIVIRDNGMVINTTDGSPLGKLRTLPSHPIGGEFIRYHREAKRFG